MFYLMMHSTHFIDPLLSLYELLFSLHYPTDRIVHTMPSYTSCGELAHLSIMSRFFTIELHLTPPLKDLLPINIL